MIISKYEENVQRIDRKNPAFATIKERYPLTQKDSTKQVYHLALDLKGIRLQFQVGDSIGVFPQNDPQHVRAILSALGAQGDEIIIEARSKESMSLSAFLTYKANLLRLSSSFLRCVCNYVTAHEMKKYFCNLLLPENKLQLGTYLEHNEVLDLLTACKDARLPLQELCAEFSPLLPRFYSIASSPYSITDEVHLTVALTAYTHRDQVRYGVTSHFLCHLAEVQTTAIPIYVQPAHHFTLPKDDNAEIIMVGPGTGIAPFRAFLQERLHRNATGKNWLFFGERHRQFNYYYQEFLEDLAQRKLLKLHVAFSRDQEDKIYVQHMMYSHAKQLFAALEEGAHLYVCGDAKRMAKDVEIMLHTIISEQGNLSFEEAKNYIKALRAQKRYLCDVY